MVEDTKNTNTVIMASIDSLEINIINMQLKNKN
jgi:hypothetical protein